MSNLDHDIREAARLGYEIHYGRYKADHPSTAPKIEAGLPKRARRCAECDALFIPRRVNQLYCCEACKKRRSDRDAARRRISNAEM